MKKKKPAKKSRPLKKAKVARKSATRGRPLRIGVSACFFHADPKRAIFKGKTLQYLELSIARWIMDEGALVYMVPSPADNAVVNLKHFAQDLDGLILQGGSDVAPESYGETPLRPEWGGDRIRDIYEIELFKAFTQLGKPVFGICRGLQLINVAMGGTLYQDTSTQKGDAITHRDWEIYDQLFHEIHIEKGSKLSKLYGFLARAKVNSVHHQAVKDLAPGLLVEARSVEDNVVESFRSVKGPYVCAVQWHPEFQDPSDKSLLDRDPLLKDFLEQAKKSRGDK